MRAPPKGGSSIGRPCKRRTQTALGALAGAHGCPIDPFPLCLYRRAAGGKGSCEGTSRTVPARAPGMGVHTCTLPYPLSQPPAQPITAAVGATGAGKPYTGFRV